MNKQTKGKPDMIEFFRKLAKQAGARRQSFTGATTVTLVGESDVFETLRVLNQANRTDLVNLLSWVMAQQYGQLASEEFYQYTIEYGKLQGDKRPVLRNQACFDLARSKLPYVIDRVYTDKYFEGDVHQQSSRMIDELRGSLKSILKETSWLDQKTKDYAVEKLEAMSAHLGAAKWILDSTQLDDYYNFVKKVDIVPNQLLDTVFGLERVYVREAFDLNGTQVKKMSPVWNQIPPLTANAANFLNLNQIVIPTGIIRPPFFDGSWPYMMNYGHLGAIIGHELTHGFDNHGSQFGKTGEYENWWNEKTLQEFTNRSQCFVKQYGSIYDKRAKLNVNGEQTLGENIADNGGLKEAFRAFQNHQKSDGHPGPVLPGIKANPEQLYFLSWAWNWCDTYSPETLQRQIGSDLHAPDRYRTLVPLQNSPDFAKAFNCPAGSSMNPSHKCAVW